MPLGNDTLFLFSQGLASTSIFEGSVTCAAPSLFGKSMLKKSNGENVFTNYQGDSIFIPTLAALHDTTFFTRADSGAYYATFLESIGTYSIFNQLDTAKYFRLYSFDSTGTRIDLDHDGDYLILSRTFGIVHGHDLYAFPGSSTEISLAGQMNPDLGVTNLTAPDIFDFEIGDEFHYSAGYHDSHAPRYYTKKVVINKNVTGTDSVLYTFETQNVVMQSDIHPNPPYSDETVTEHLFVSHSSHPELEALPGVWSNGILVNMTDADEKSTSSENSYADSCRYSNIEDCDAYLVYQRGLGQTTYRIFGSLFCGTSYSKQLVYHKKGSITSGSPIDFAYLAHYIDSITGAEAIFTPEELQFITMPGYAELRFQFKEEQALSIQLFNVIGQSVYQNNLTQQSGNVILPFQTQGTYLLVVAEGKRKQTFRWIN